MRVDGWERILIEAVEAARAAPFEWGVNDCATWAFDLVARLRGVASEADAWRGQYSTEAGAARMIRKLGHADMEGLVRARMGEPLPAVLLAGRGDLVLTPERIGVGIVAGGFAVGMAPGGGLVSFAIRACPMGWRV